MVMDLFLLRSIQVVVMLVTVLGILAPRNEVMKGGVGGLPRLKYEPNREKAASKLRLQKHLPLQLRP